MLYIIYGTQSYSIQYRYKKIAKDILGDIDDLNYSKLDFNDVSFQDIINEADSVPLGYDQKVVVVNNASFLLKETKSLKEDKEYQLFISYIKTIDESITLILAILNKDIDSKSEVYNIINVKGKILGLNESSEQEWIAYVEAYIKKNGGNIEKPAIYELAKRTSGDVALLRNTADKLMLYTPNITLKDVNLMVNKPLEENVFQIYNNLISNHTDMALKIYRDLVEQNVEPISLISTLAKQFRLLYQIKYLVKERKNNKDIASILNIKEGRVYVISKQVYNVDESKLRATLDELYNLDLQIKSGVVDRFYALEMFIIKYNKDR